MTTPLARLRRAAAPAVVAIAAVVLAACGDAPSTRSDAEIARTAAVRVEAAGCETRAAMGGGSFIASGRVLTVAHVVAGATSVVVVLADGTRLPAAVAAIDRGKDLAVLEVAADVRPLRVGTMRVGAAGVFVANDPGDAIVRDFHADAFVEVDASSLEGGGDGRRRAYRLDADVDPGDSGSILVSGGHAVAVIFARSTARAHIAWATDIREATSLLTTPAGTVADTGSCVGVPPSGGDDD